MSVAIHVDAYSSHKADERPQRFVLDDQDYEIVEVEDRYEPDAAYFRVRTTEGQRYILKHKEPDDEWTLQGGFDGDALLSRPTVRLVTVDADRIRRAERMIASCEHCDRETAEIPFDWVLDRVTGCDGGTTDYVLGEPARCQRCSKPVLEKTLVDLRDDDGPDSDDALPVTPSDQLVYLGCISSSITLETKGVRNIG